MMSFVKVQLSPVEKIFQKKRNDITSNAHNNAYFFQAYKLVDREINEIVPEVLHNNVIIISTRSHQN